MVRSMAAAAAAVTTEAHGRYVEQKKEVETEIIKYFSMNFS